MIACYVSECAMRDCVTCPRYDEQYKSEDNSQLRRNNKRKGVVRSNAAKGSATRITVK